MAFIRNINNQLWDEVGDESKNEFNAAYSCNVM